MDVLFVDILLPMTDKYCLDTGDGHTTTHKREIVANYESIYRQELLRVIGYMNKCPFWQGYSPPQGLKNLMVVGPGLQDFAPMAQFIVKGGPSNPVRSVTNTNYSRLGSKR